MPLALPRAIKIDLYCEVLNINNDLGVFSIPRQASGTKNTWVIIYTLHNSLYYRIFYYGDNKLLLLILQCILL